MVFHLDCIPGVCPVYLISKENVMKALTTPIAPGLRGSGNHGKQLMFVLENKSTLFGTKRIKMFIR